MKKIVLILIVSLIILSPIFVNAQPEKGTIHKKQISDCSLSPLSIYLQPFLKTAVTQNTIKSPSCIDNYTWAVMRYDTGQRSENHGTIGLVTPTAGTVLIPANMMTPNVCHAALSVRRESNMETLQAFDEYVSERMLHTSSAFHDGEDEWHTESCYNFRKESALEMTALGEVCLRADLVGECYAQASFNTAVLRLCGFSAEEVFTIGIQCNQGGHAINAVKVDQQWYVIDSTYAKYVRLGMRDGVIFEKYFSSPLTDNIVFLENDKYLINFGTLFPQYIPTMKDPYLNMDVETLYATINGICPLLNNSYLGKNKWTLDSFVENATPNPFMKTVSVPYTVDDAKGATIEEKATDLASRCQEFIRRQKEENTENQYDKSCYAYGLLQVERPQVYANAAKYAAWTSWYGVERDQATPLLDVYITSFFTHFTILNTDIVPDGCVAYSDLLYLRHAGSSIDKAILSYGTLRNMKKDADFWPVEDLYVLITEDYNGALAVRLNENWKYILFDQGTLLSNSAPELVHMAFNEIDYFESWNE